MIIDLVCQPGVGHKLVPRTAQQRGSGSTLTTVVGGAIVETGRRGKMLPAGGEELKFDEEQSTRNTRPLLNATPLLVPLV